LASGLGAAPAPPPLAFFPPFTFNLAGLAAFVGITCSKEERGRGVRL